MADQKTRSESLTIGRPSKLNYSQLFIGSVTKPSFDYHELALVINGSDK